MNTKQFQIMMDEAKTVLKDYPFFGAFSAAESSEVWSTLSIRQKKLVEQELMPHGAIGSASVSEK